METTRGNLIEWFYDDGYGFDLFIGGKGLPVTDDKRYTSNDAAIRAGLAYER